MTNLRQYPLAAMMADVHNGFDICHPSYILCRRPITKDSL